MISKQSYHVLSHVLRSIKKFEDSGKCLDCIEVCIEDQKKYDELLYNKTFAQLSAMEKSSKMNQSSSAFALEGTLDLSESSTMRSCGFSTFTKILFLMSSLRTKTSGCRGNQSSRPFGET